MRTPISRSLTQTNSMPDESLFRKDPLPLSNGLCKTNFGFILGLSSDRLEYIMDIVDTSIF